MEIPIYYGARLGEKKLKVKHGFTILRRILLEHVLVFSVRVVFRFEVVF